MWEAGSLERAEIFEVPTWVAAPLGISTQCFKLGLSKTISAFGGGVKASLRGWTCKGHFTILRHWLSLVGSPSIISIV